MCEPFHSRSFLWNSSSLFRELRQVLGRKEFLQHQCFRQRHEASGKQAESCCDSSLERRPRSPTGGVSEEVTMREKIIILMENGSKKKAPTGMKVRNAVTQPRMRHKTQTRGTTNRPRRQSADKGCSSICASSALHPILPSSLPSFICCRSPLSPSLASTPSCQQSPRWERTLRDGGRHQK